MSPSSTYMLYLIWLWISPSLYQTDQSRIYLTAFYVNSRLYTKKRKGLVQTRQRTSKSDPYHALYGEDIKAIIN